jgi:cytochrome c peroxidase
LIEILKSGKQHASEGNSTLFGRLTNSVTGAFTLLIKKIFGIHMFAAFILVALTVTAAIASGVIPNLFEFLDPSGKSSTANNAGASQQDNPFFQSLGTNGRSCATCHLASDAMGLSAASAQSRFASSGGQDPLFAPVDGANCEDAVRSDAASHSLMIGNGLVRVALDVPTGAQYSITAVNDPYGCAITRDPVNGQPVISVYRRPLPSTNLGFLSTVMFDGRETIAPLNNGATFQANLIADLTHQAIDATLGHAQASTAPTAEQVNAIVKFELGLHSAQVMDNSAGRLDAQGGLGGPMNLKNQQYYPGINDSLGSNPTGAAFNSEAFTLFSNWTSLHNSQKDPNAMSRESVAAGEKLFNTFPLTITNVRGLNDALNASSIPGTCTTCHDTPNVGNHSLPVPLDIGVSHSAQSEIAPEISAALPQLSVPELPIYRVACNAGPLSGQVIYTSDPGKALISGFCADINRVKGPVLRGLAARAPYFHNGAAASLQEVVNFYNLRFQMNLTDQQKADLIAFLRSL